MLKFYHVTLTENIASLLSNGADPSRIGENSLQSGSGFHLTPKCAWAEEWGHALFPRPLDQTTILQVTLPETIRLATNREKPEHGMLKRWGKAQGYLEKDGSPSGKLLRVAHEENWQEDSDYFLNAMNEGVPSALMGLYLTKQGFDGYWVDNDLVLTNFSLLLPSVFAMASNIYHQVITIQDAETGHCITLRLSPGANGLMVYCYQGEQTQGEPMRSFQVASYEDQLEILYWDATMSNEQDSKRLVLVENILAQSQSDNQRSFNPPKTDTVE